jgi:hypothetical protein
MQLTTSGDHVEGSAPGLIFMELTNITPEGLNPVHTNTIPRISHPMVSDCRNNPVESCRLDPASNTTQLINLE